MRNFKHTLFVLYEKYMFCIGIFSNISFILQAHTIIVSQTSLGVSLPAYCITLISLISWLVYGIMIKDSVLIWVNVLAVSLASFCMAVIVYYR